MSNPTLFRYDICQLKAKDMDCMDIAKTDEGSEVQDESQKMEKLKESHLLLKKKLSLSHELIKQYNDKMKECEELNNELKAVKSNVEKITQNHNSSLIKITQLELENNEYRKKIDNFTKIVSEQETKIAADRQHLQQLICKVKELECKETGHSKRNDACKEKIKTLEEKLREVKKSHEMEIKAMEIKVANVVRNEIKHEAKVVHEKSTSTGNELEVVKVLPEMSNKCTMTNEFYSIKNDPYPLFCSKCKVKLDPAPLDQIFEQMSSCPALLTEVRSPAKKPTRETGNSHVIPKAPSETKLPHHELLPHDSLIHRSTSLETFGGNLDVSKSDFQRLEHKICSLERKLRKKLKKQEANRPSTCCGYQHPNNCYFGPYPSFLQPGPGMRNPGEFLGGQSWQEGLRGRKRSFKTVNRKANCRGRKKCLKKRKLEDGTSEWNVDSVPIKDRVNSDRVNAWGSDSDTVEDSLRARSPPTQFKVAINRASKRRKVSESSSLSRLKKREKQLVDLFSPAHSPASRTRDPDTNSSTDEEILSEPRVPSPEINCAVSETVSDEEVAENGDGESERSFEYETVECTSKKGSKRGNKPVKKSTKNSLLSKIKNLKKNCNKVKPLPSSAFPAKDNASKIICSEIYGENGGTNEPKNDLSNIPPTQGDPTLNAVSDYCPGKKQRIAHSARKRENESLDNTNENSVEVSKTVDTEKPNSIEDGCVNDDEINDSISQPAAVISKVNYCVEKSEKIECKESLNPVIRFKRSSSLKNHIDSKNPRLANNKVFKNDDIERVEDEANRDPSVNISEVNKTLNASLQPCVMIPKLYLGIESVTSTDAHLHSTQSIDTNKTEEDHYVTNLNSSSGNDASLRILRSHSKVTESNTVCAGTTDSPLSPVDETSKPATDVPECDESSKEISENEKAEPVVASIKYKRKVKVKASSVSPIRELRSRRIMLSPSTTLSSKISLKQEIETETLSHGGQISEKINARLGFSARALIEEKIMKMGNSKKQNTGKQKTVNQKLQQRRENLVTKELSKLTEDERWTTAVLQDTIEALSKFKTHTIAKCVINFLCIKAETNEALDRTYTPPAPLLSKTQQRILILIVVLKRTIPDIIKLVLTGIEYKLFRLGWAPEVAEVVELTRFFTALCRIEKDREKVRILCCDALYCFGLKAMCLIYVIFISWPEVLPMAGSSNDPLLLCLIELIMTQQGDPSFPKFFALKKLLSVYYKYEPGGQGGNTLIKKFLQTLKEERQNGLDTAIILFAKKKESIWVYENIIKGGLLQMIIQNSHPSIYDAFCLLGHLMRSFPIDDKKGLVNNLFEQLKALMESGEGSMQQQEGVASALLSLTRHKLYDVAKVIIKWEPKERISERMSQELTTLFNIHPPGWWRKFIRKNCEESSSVG